jgi:hypothetical protein
MKGGTRRVRRKRRERAEAHQEALRQWCGLLRNAALLSEHGIDPAAVAGVHYRTIRYYDGVIMREMVLTVRDGDEEHLVTFWLGDSGAWHRVSSYSVVSAGELV